jgi:hypothetical protein
LVVANFKNLIPKMNFEKLAILGLTDGLLEQAPFLNGPLASQLGMQ